MSNQEDKETLLTNFKELCYKISQDNKSSHYEKEDRWGELPSSYLTRKLTPYNRRICMDRIMDPTNNTLVSDIESIKEVVHHFYNNTFKKPEDDHETLNIILEKWEKELNDTQIKKLQEPITQLEVERAIVSTDPKKAPGPDGLTVTLYKKFIKHIVGLLTRIYNDFLEGKHIPSTFKEGFMFMTYKNKASPDDLKNWRPITLLNIDYKLLTKILNSRLKEIAPTIIGPHQQGFVPGRSI